MSWGGTICGAVAEVHLVAVVGRRVVRRRDHHAGGARRARSAPTPAPAWAAAGQQPGRIPTAAMTRAVSRAKTSLLRRASYPITTPRSAPRSSSVEQVRRQPGGGLPHDQPVHPQRPGADRRRAARRCRTSAVRRTGPPARRRVRRAGRPARLGCRRPARPRATARPRSRPYVGSRSRQQGTQLDERPRPDVADHLGGGDRAEPGALGERQRRAVAVEEARPRTGRRRRSCRALGSRLGRHATTPSRRSRRTSPPCRR